MWSAGFPLSGNEIATIISLPFLLNCFQRGKGSHENTHGLKVVGIVGIMGNGIQYLQNLKTLSA